VLANFIKTDKIQLLWQHPHSRVLTRDCLQNTHTSLHFMKAENKRRQCFRKTTEGICCCCFGFSHSTKASSIS